ncbi:hypothetical protein ACILR7_08450 [Bacillus atrophaeus]|uniref:hypothetical protein n=1 Tax=Bacillus atrophaeus TaxID=1452 RepID=UPI00381283DF
MECQPNNDPQMLRDSNNNGIIRTIEGVFLRYPSENNDKVDQACKQLAEAEANKLIDSYNLFSEPKLKYHHVNVYDMIGKTKTEKNDLTGERHWQWKGSCKFETYVTCE